MRERFDITVEVLDCVQEETAIATASAYLAYGDQTDTFGYAPTMVGVTVQEDGDGPIAVTIGTILRVQDDDHLKAFMDELTRMSKVVSVERGDA